MKTVAKLMDPMWTPLQEFQDIVVTILKRAPSDYLEKNSLWFRSFIIDDHTGLPSDPSIKAVTPFREFTYQGSQIYLTAESLKKLFADLS